MPERRAHVHVGRLDAPGDGWPERGNHVPAAPLGRTDAVRTVDLWPMRPCPFTWSRFPLSVKRSSQPMARPTHKASLAVVFLTVMVDLLGFGLILPLIPVYAKELMVGFSRAQMGWALGLLMTCYSIMQLGFAPFWGRLSDRVGRRPILILSLTGSTFFYALFALATLWGSLFWMFLSRIGGGIAGATIPTAQAYIADVTPMDKRTRGMALIGVAFGLGFTFGPLMGAVALMGEGRAGASPWPGFTAAAFSAAALVLAVIKLRESLDPGRVVPARRRLDLRSLHDALTTPSIALLLAVLCLCNFSFSNFEATLSLVLASFLGVGRGGREILLAFAFVGMVQTLVQGGVVRPLAAWLSEGTLCGIGATLAVAGYVMMATAAAPPPGVVAAVAAGQAVSLTTAASQVVRLMVGAGCVVAGLGFVYPSLQSLISRRSDPSKQGGVMGVASSLNSLARILGIMAATQLYSLVSQTAPFWTATGLMASALGLVAIAIRAGEDWRPKPLEAVASQPLPVRE
ncbi:MAG TPA: MFS transporter [Planctomycetes bacterium]|nr:MFS transporter [Planctomycetota bacterium]